MNNPKESNDAIQGNKLPQRGDSIYDEIEKFAHYELTHCIAYEMGIRNQDVQRIIFLLDRLSLIHKQIVTGIHQEVEEMPKEIIQLTEKLLQQDYQEYYKLIDNNVNKLAILPQYIALLTTVLKEQYYMFYDRAVLLPSELYKIVHNSNDITSDRETNSFIHNALFHKTILDSDDSVSYIDNCKIEEGYVVYQGAYSSTNEFDLNKIFTNFKRPMYEPNQIQIALNLSLPKEELLEYIKIIKNDYDSKESNIKNPLELLGKELGISALDLKEMTQKQWADCFYIYDVFIQLEQKHSMEEIYSQLQNHLTRYNGVKVKRTTEELKKRKKGDNAKFRIMSYNAYIDKKQKDEEQDYDNFLDDEKSFYSLRTIADRLKLMKTLINNLKYKTLILN